MGSAYHITEANIQTKFNENHFMGKGDMDQTRNSRLNPMTFNCDLGLDFACLRNRFCTPSLSEHLTKV